MQRIGSFGPDVAGLRAAGPEVELEITRGRAVHRTRRVETNAFLIGAAPDCDLVIGDPQFAAVHCCLLVKRDRITIRHLGFEPGLSVNGQEVSWASLTNGDTLRFGPYEFRLGVRWPQGVSTGPRHVEIPNPRITREGVRQRAS